MTDAAVARLGGFGSLDADQLGRLVDQLPVLLWSTDTQLRITSRRGGGLATLGMWPQQPMEGVRVGTTIEDPAEGARVLAAHQAALRGEPTAYELTVRNRMFSARVEPWRDAAGTICGVVGLAFDVTDRRRVELALLESETRLRTIIETEPECVKLVDKDGKLLDMNPAGVAMVEAECIELLRGQPVDQLVAPEHRAAFADLRRRVFEGTSGTLEFELIGMRGTRRWLDTHAVPLRDNTGTIVALLSITRDVTTRKLTEQALRESEERLQLVTRATNEAVWDWDLVTNALWWGRGFEDLFGYSRDEVEPGIESWKTRIHPDDGDRVVASIHASIESGNATWSSEYRFRRKDGVYADIYDRGYVMHTPDGRPTRMVGSMMDVTQRKRAEAQLQASRTALRLLATRHQDVREEERSRIAREIHDSLGQALTALKLHLAAAHDAAARGTPCLAERLAESTQMVDDLVKSVRKIATELRPPILDQLGLPAAIEWVAHDFTRRTGIPCTATIVPEMATISAELGTALFRIVQEALTNVVRHAAATRVEIALQVKPDLITLEVTDDGRGITEAAVHGPGSLGILGMRERAAAQGGVLEVGPVTPHGTRISAWFPPLRSRK